MRFRKDADMIRIKETLNKLRSLSRLSFERTESADGSFASTVSKEDRTGRGGRLQDATDLRTSLDFARLL
jgi:hypothetical protein